MPELSGKRFDLRTIYKLSLLYRCQQGGINLILKPMILPLQIYHLNINLKFRHAVSHYSLYIANFHKNIKKAYLLYMPSDYLF